MNLTCYVVDDEYHAIELLQYFIQKTPGLELVGQSTNPILALEEITTGKKPNLVFLDVDMPELSGLELAGMVNHKTTVIFTTSYREYALEAFEKEATDYLLKPIAYERFLKSIQKAKREQVAKAMSNGTAELAFYVKTGLKGKLNKVNIAEVRYVAGLLNYIEIYLENSKLITYLSLTEILGKLPEENFSRIHKSYIVNHDYIYTMEYWQVSLKDSTNLPIGRAYRKDFQQKMGVMTLKAGRD